MLLLIHKVRKILQNGFCKILPQLQVHTYIKKKHILAFFEKELINQSQAIKRQYLLYLAIIFFKF